MVDDINNSVSNNNSNLSADSCDFLYSIRRGRTGATGPTGPTGPTGAAAISEFAHFTSCCNTLNDGTTINISLAPNNLQGNITHPTPNTIGLEPGNYLINYTFSAIISGSDSYVQITPIYNGSAQTQDSSTDYRPYINATVHTIRTFIINVPVSTTLSFRLNTNDPNGVSNSNFAVSVIRLSN